MKVILILLCWLSATVAKGQTADDKDIWRSVQLGEVDYQKARNYAVRLYAYYRYTDDGMIVATDREFRLYRVYEGICAIDIRYDRDEDDGAEIMAARNLVHPDRPGQFMDFYELKPYTFLEKARRDTRHFSIVASGDTQRVYTRHGLAGTAVADTARHELRTDYNALAPDTAKTINLLVVKARLANVAAKAVYHTDEGASAYVPQGNLKRIVFDGDITIESPISVALHIDDMTAKGKLRTSFHEHTEIYVDSVVYMTRDEFRADRKLSAQQRRERSGYGPADIDRLRLKLGAGPLTATQLRRMEEQRDWDDEFEQWEQNLKRKHQSHINRE